MKNELTSLAELSKIDSEIDVLVSQREEIPSLLSELQAKQAAQHAGVASKKAEIASLEAEKRQKELEKAEKIEWVTKRDERLRDIKNNKEYHAALKEITQAKKIVAQLEEDLKRLDERLVEENSKIADLEKNSVETVSSIELEMTQKQELAVTLEVQIKEKSSIRLDQETKINPSILKKYKTIKNRVSPALALAQDGTCLECHTRVPPQMYIELQKLNQLISCPRCHRILFIEG